MHSKIPNPIRQMDGYGITHSPISSKVTIFSLIMNLYRHVFKWVNCNIGQQNRNVTIALLGTYLYCLKFEKCLESLWQKISVEHI